jgi:hypothetical protein
MNEKYTEKNPLAEMAEKIANDRAAKMNLEVTEWIATHAKPKLLFKRWIWIFCDMKDFKFKDETLNL